MKKYIKKWISDIEYDLKTCKSKDCKSCKTLQTAKERFENDLKLIEEKKEKISNNSWSFNELTQTYNRCCKDFDNEISLTFVSEKVINEDLKKELFEAKTLKELNKTLKKIV